MESKHHSHKAIIIIVVIAIVLILIAASLVGAYFFFWRKEHDIGTRYYVKGSQVVKSPGYFDLSLSSGSGGGQSNQHLYHHKSGLTTIGTTGYYSIAGNINTLLTHSQGRISLHIVSPQKGILGENETSLSQLGSPKPSCVISLTKVFLEAGDTFKWVVYTGAASKDYPITVNGWISCSLE